MPIRTTRSQVTFNVPFVLAEVDGELPAGTYDIDTDEEVIEGNERTVYVRTATLIHIRGLGSTRIVTIDPLGLEAACADEQHGSG
ncbi:hypothetical protein G7A66_02400 [Altererythrobacter sp. SALINAS58]|uniref:hypothetical protein n=1 Tax=Alteripontixanthobacter muriae TaxID=2705546 RepID=UPI001576BA6A|nr:hypothetical protein [Alteripontixanthobacter muriae]NTZ41961.1 hypothetical protein [Alteripontixanthobacter muriae]